VDERLNSSQIKPKRTPKPAKTERQQNFVRNLRWAIERLGLTLIALAKKAGVKETWLRRAATQGVYWTKKTEKDPVKKLEEFLGCPPNTLWEQEGHSFRSGVADKHLRGRDPVSAFEQVVRHFEESPPPLLSTVIEIIQFLRRSIDDPSIEPPKEKYRQLLDQLHGEMVTWDRSSGWRFSDAVINHIIEPLNARLKHLTEIGVPGVSAIHVGREQIEKWFAGFDLTEIDYVVWVEVYATKYGMETDEVYRLVDQKHAEYEAKRAEEAERQAKEIAAKQALEAPRQEEGIKVSRKIQRKHAASPVESLPAEVEAARQVASEHAALLIDSLSPVQRDYFLKGFQQHRYQALKNVESQLFKRLTGEGQQTQMTIEQAVQNVRTKIAEDYWSWVDEQSTVSKPDEDSPEYHELDDEQKARNERKKIQDILNRIYGTKE